MQVVIEIIIHVLISWASGSDNIWAQRIAYAIAYLFVGGLLALGLYLYISNLQEMSLAASILWGFAILLLYSTIFAIYWAIKRAVQDKVGE